MEKEKLNTYILLLQDFMHNNIKVSDFVEKYMDLFSNERGMSEEIYEILNNLFLDVEAHDENPAVKFSINEGQLRNSVATSLEKLKSLDTYN